MDIMPKKNSSLEWRLMIALLYYSKGKYLIARDIVMEAILECKNDRLIVEAWADLAKYERLLNNYNAALDAIRKAYAIENANKKLRYVIFKSIINEYLCVLNAIGQHDEEKKCIEDRLKVLKEEINNNKNSFILGRIKKLFFRVTG